MPGITIVVLLHVALVYGLVSGLGTRVISVVRAPIETKIIEEVRKPIPETPLPPPPKLQTPQMPYVPPPEINIQVAVQQAPAITATTPTPPPPNSATVAVAPPAPPSLPQVRRDYKAAFRVEPQFPRQAITRGIDGRVVAWVHVNPAGQVTSVEIKQTTGAIFTAEVIRALSQWKFNPEPVGFIGEYQIVFQLQQG